LAPGDLSAAGGGAIRPPRASIGRLGGGLARRLPIPIVGLSLLVFPFVVKDPFWQNVLVLVLIYGSAATAWNLLGGFTGQVSFGHSIFFGVGAYATGLAVVHGGLPWVGMLGGAVAAAALGVIIGFPVFRLRSHYFAIATIAMLEVVFVVVSNVQAIGGATGFPVPMRPYSLANLQFSTRDLTPYHLVALGLLGLSSLAVWLFMRGRAGAYVRAIRDDDVVAQSLGVRVRLYKLYSIALSSALTALAGGLYGMFSLFIDPNVVLGLDFAVQLVLICVLGGIGTFWGPLVGAFVLVLIQQETRVHFSGGGNALDFVIYGLLVVLIAVIEPSGLIGLARRVLRRTRRHLGRRTPAEVPAR
jgi:branched-chain amino acid transport system permease protein